MLRSYEVMRRCKRKISDDVLKDNLKKIKSDAKDYKVGVLFLLTENPYEEKKSENPSDRLTNEDFITAQHCLKNVVREKSANLFVPEKGGSTASSALLTEDGINVFLCYCKTPEEVRFDEILDGEGFTKCGLNELDYKIIRGANRIGGTITEISYNGKRIWVDFGANLSAVSGKESDEYMIKLMQTNPPDAVCFTHAHGDHTGLFCEISADVKEIYMGGTTEKILRNVHDTLSGFAKEEKLAEKLKKESIIFGSRKIVHYCKSGKSMDICGMKVTPIEIDHSVCNAYMLLFEAGGKKVLHTGDFRKHGTRGEELFEKVKSIIIANKPIDVLICEGTMMSRTDEELVTEADLEEKAEEYFRDNKNIFLMCSSTNMESLASFYSAFCKEKKGRKFLVSRYVKKQLDLYSKAYGKENERFCFEDVSVWRTLTDCRKKYSAEMNRDGFFFPLTNPDNINKYKDFINEFGTENTAFIYSIWAGYFKEGKNKKQEMSEFKKEWEECGGNFILLHSGGHAPAEDIEALIEAVSPKETVVPVHTENAAGFIEFKKYKEIVRICKN